MTLIVAIFLISCDPITNEDNELNDVDKNLNDMENVENTNTLTETTDGDCQEGWKCIGDNKMVYQNSDCSFGEKKDCNTICVDDVCKPAKVCETGFKCIDDERRGYQKEDCSWIKKEECDFGCSSGKCNPMPEGYNETEEVEETESVPVNSYAEENLENVTVEPDVSGFSYLSFGETIEINGHTVKIHNIESGQVIINIDGIKSEWLMDGDSHEVNDLRITVREILFQGYAGGIMRIGYSVG